MTGPPHRATFSFKYDTERRAEVIAGSLRREVGEIDGDRSRTGLTREGGELAIRIDADDLVALRAATNTWLSLVGVAESAVDVGEHHA